jgi:hypothetical protein
MENIHYDILECIIQKLDLIDIINFLSSSKKIYKLYKNNDEAYGYNKITNKIIRECSLFFKIDDTINKKYNNKKLLRDTFIKMYNIYKNNKNYDNVDILIYIMENNIKSHEIFRCFCLKSKFKNIEKNHIKYNNGNINYEKNIISNLDMKYMLINLDKYKLEIILKVFHIESDIIVYCINELLLHKKSEYDIKIKIFIDYIFYKFCFKEISQHCIQSFNCIFACFILYDDHLLLKYFVTKLEKYLKVHILNIDYITNIMCYNLKCNNYYYLKSCIKNYVDCLAIK